MNFVWKEKKNKRIIIMTKTIVFTIVMVKPNNQICRAPYAKY